MWLYLGEPSPLGAALSRPAMAVYWCICEMAHPRRQMHLQDSAWSLGFCKSWTHLWFSGCPLNHQGLAVLL